MSESYRYPENVNTDEEFTPELMVLWNDAMRELGQRRNQSLRWQIPTIIVGVPLALIITNGMAFFLIILVMIGLGLACNAMRLTYHYKCSEDRKSAKFDLGFAYDTKRIFDYPLRIFSTAKEGIGGLYMAFIGTITLPFTWPVRSIAYAVEFLNERWWLTGFRAWTARLQEIADGKQGRQHYKGTDVLPSVALSGSSPVGDGAKSVETMPLEVLDGRLVLNPDGGLIILGGPTFDCNSTFSSFSVNGMSLTRQSSDLLSVTTEDKESSFRFDGSCWSEV